MKSTVKINMVVAARFNASSTVTALAQCSHLDIYTSVPSSYWPGDGFTVNFVPHLSLLANRAFKHMPSRRFKDISAILFAKLASRRLQADADIVYCWASFALESLLWAKKRQIKTLLDRACPHILYQEKILADESQRLGVPFVGSSPRLLQRCLREYELANTIIVPSQYTARTFLQQGVKQSKIQVISLGPNFSPLATAVVAKKGKKSRANFVVGIVAGNVLRKGLLYALQAWQKLQLPNAKLKLKCPIGELKLFPKVWKLINKDESIEIVAHQKTMHAFYESIDVLCLPSIDEGFGMVVWEAIAHGCPVIVSENVGAADWVVEGDNGFVVPIRCSDAIADKIETLYTDRDFLSSMSMCCLDSYNNYLNSVESYGEKMRHFIKTHSGTTDIRDKV